MFRDQAAILQILFNTNQPISGNILIQVTGFGLKTLKREIEILNDQCQANGCVIESKVGYGYYLRVTDQKLYDAFKKQITNFYNENKLFRNEQVERIHYILRQVLTADSIRIQKLAIDCSCSESTISRDMESVRFHLQGYQLKLENHTNRGMSVSGDEWHIRMAILKEEYVYRTYQRTYKFIEDRMFASLFFNYDDTVGKLRQAVISVLKDAYAVPYTSIRQFINLISLTLNRQNKATMLLESEPIFTKHDISQERRTVREILAKVPALAVFPLSDCEEACLAAYLWATRTIKYSEFLKLPEHQHISTMMLEFIGYLASRYELAKVDLSFLEKDLCCEMTRLLNKSEIDLHTNHQDVKNFHREGIRNLDMCTMLYIYLRDKQGLYCNKNDILEFYYIFAYLSVKIKEANRNKVLMISRQGYYGTRIIAQRFMELSPNNNIEIIPLEFLDLNKVDLKPFSAIITDVNGIAERYPDKMIIKLRYIRNSQEVIEINNEILNNSDSSRKKIFKESDLLYVDRFQDIEEIYDYLRNEILLPNEDKELYISSLRERNEVYSPKRKNQIMVLNSLGDVLGRSFIKIIILKESYFMPFSYINKIVVYNVVDWNQEDSTNYHDAVSNLLHSYSFVPSYDKATDYESLYNIICK